MSKKKRATRQLKTALIITGVLVIGAVIIGGLWVSRRSASGGDGTLRDSDTAFSVSTHVGQPAPEFMAIGVDVDMPTPGKYTFKAEIESGGKKGSATFPWTLKQAGRT